MKILLVGEYSRLHNSLKEGLQSLGHDVVLIATGDHFKKFPADIQLKLKYHTGIMKYVKVGIYKIFGVDITAKSIRRQFFKNAERLRGFDVVQLINESPFGLMPEDEKVFIDFLHRNNEKMFLLSCGTDHLSVKYALSDDLPYTILKEYKDKRIAEAEFKYVLKYISPAFEDLHRFVYERIRGVIASDLDYHLPLVGRTSYLGMIPNPVNIDQLEKIKLPEPLPIRIFLGINRSGYHTKGIRYFEEALEIIRSKYPEKVEIKIVENLPYKEYIEIYNESHILLDQALGQDQGYNALEAMAKGKVVFTGADKPFREHYGLEETVAINALPDAQYIADQLEALILEPEDIKRVGASARKFVATHHDYRKIAQKYLDTWSLR